MMARTLCVWYPDWTETSGNGSPSSDDTREGRLFEAVVTAIEDLVPRVEVAEPGLVYVPVAGAVRYYGGEETLVSKVRERIPPGARLGLADGPFAARCAAGKADVGPLIVEDTSGFLAALGVESLEPTELADTFRWLGVSTLGDLAGLPRAAVASRFGEQGLIAHRLATGEDRRPHPRPISPDFVVESHHHEEPLELAEQVAFVTRSLAVEMIAKLGGMAAYRVLVEVEAVDGTHRRRVWRSSYPFTDSGLTERVWWQVRAWIDTPGGVPGGVARIRLDPSDLSDEGRQLALLEQVGGGEGGWQEIDDGRHDAERALTRAQALVGPDAVLQAVRRGGRMPHELVEWYPWGDRTPPSDASEDAPWPGRTPSPFPALTTATPPRLEVEWEAGMPVRVRLGTRWEPVLSWSGPWRMTGRWWEGEGPADRYQIVTSVGAVLCVVEEDGTYLAAVYD